MVYADCVAILVVERAVRNAGENKKKQRLVATIKKHTLIASRGTPNADCVFVAGSQRQIDIGFAITRKADLRK